MEPGTGLDDIDTPALIVDLDRMASNIEAMARLGRDGDLALRPHVKSHKIPELALLQMEAGAVGITCQKLGEAEVMADAGLSDITIAYPIIGAREAPSADRPRPSASASRRSSTRWKARGR